MTSLKNYLEYEKSNSSPKEADFSYVLNRIEVENMSIRSEVLSKNTAIENKIKTEYFGWAFGFVGFSMAAFMFFFTPTQQSNVAIVSKQEVETLREKSKKAVEVIDSIDSFNVEQSDMEGI